MSPHPVRAAVALCALLTACNTYQATPTAAAAAQPETCERDRPARAMFVWNTEIAGDVPATELLLEFSTDRGITDLYVDADPVGYGVDGAATRYGDLVARAHASGLRVWALGGHPWWTVPCRTVDDQLTCYEGGWGFYSNVAYSGVPFDGIVDDSEPHSAQRDRWRDEPQQRAAELMEFVAGVKRHSAGLTVIKTVPSWFDDGPLAEIALDGGTPHSLTWHVAGAVDRIAVTAYRDQADAPDGIIDRVRGEMDVGLVVVGVETDHVDPDRITFWEEGAARMEGELAHVTHTYCGNPNFTGSFIHHYESFALLAP